MDVWCSIIIHLMPSGQGFSQILELGCWPSSVTELVFKPPPPSPHTHLMHSTLSHSLTYTSWVLLSNVVGRSSIGLLLVCIAVG